MRMRWMMMLIMVMIIFVINNAIIAIDQIMTRAIMITRRWVDVIRKKWLNNYPPSPMVIHYSSPPSPSSFLTILTRRQKNVPRHPPQCLRRPRVLVRTKLSLMCRWFQFKIITFWHPQKLGWKNPHLEININHTSRRHWLHRNKNNHKFIFTHVLGHRSYGKIHF